MKKSAETHNCSSVVCLFVFNEDLVWDFSSFKVVLGPTGVYRKDTHFCTSGVLILDYCHLSYWVQSRPSNSAGCAYRSADGRPSFPQCSLAHKPRSSDRGYPESEALHTVARDRFLSRQGDEHVPHSQTPGNISVQPRHQGRVEPRTPDCESETIPLGYTDGCRNGLTCF